MIISGEKLGRLTDVMRIVSAVLIFYYHAGIYVCLPLSAYGDFAVNTFIILAIVATFAFSRAGEQPGFAAYMWSRVKRIFPMYISINLVIFAASYVYPSRLGQPFTGRQFMFSSLALSQLFNQRFLSEVFWFVPFILQVYVIIALLRRHLMRLHWPAFFIIAFAISALEISLLAQVMGDALIETRKWSPLLRLPEFGFGVITAALLARAVTGRAFIFYVAIYGLLAVLLACVGSAIPNARYLFMLPLNGLIVTIAIAITSALLLFVIERVSISTSALRSAGRATFPFFLIHGIGLRFVDARWHSQTAAWLAYLFACMVAAVALEFMFGAAFARKPVLQSAGTP